MPKFHFEFYKSYRYGTNVFSVLINMIPKMDSHIWEKRAWCFTVFVIFSWDVNNGLQRNMLVLFIQLFIRFYFYSVARMQLCKWPILPERSIQFVTWCNAFIFVKEILFNLNGEKIKYQQNTRFTIFTKYMNIEHAWFCNK